MNYRDLVNSSNLELIEGLPLYHQKKPYVPRFDTPTFYTRSCLFFTMPISQAKIKSKAREPYLPKLP